MTNPMNELRRANSRAGAWRWAAMLLVVAMVGVFVGRAQSDAIEGPRNLEALLQPVDEKGAVDGKNLLALGPVQPAGVPGAPGAAGAVEAVVQPSSSVEATALAIAYHAIRSGDAKVTPEAVGKFAAEMMNAFSAARK